MIEIQVRPAQTADAPSLYQSWMAARQYYANHDARLVLAPISESEFAVGLRTTVERPDAQIFVSEDKYTWTMLGIQLVEGVVLPLVMVLTFELVFRPRAAAMRTA